MKFIINLLKNTKMAYAIRKNLLLKQLIKSIYKIIMFPFTRKGIDINIGGIGVYKLDYHFAFSDYEGFGNRHNAGFKRWVECCKDMTAVFDIGAHIGLYTIPASRVVAPNGAVYAFEPSEANRKYLKQHLKYNNISNVVIFPFIVGEETKKRQIFYENRYADPMNSLYPKKRLNLYSEVYREQVNLNDFVKKYDIKPQVIKIDVEGSEYSVLKGAGEVIERFHPLIFLSVHPEQLALAKSSVDELKKIIDDLWYEAQDESGKPVTEFQRKEYILMPA